MSTPSSAARVALTARLCELARKGATPRFHVFGHIHEDRGVQIGADLKPHVPGHAAAKAAPPGGAPTTGHAAGAIATQRLATVFINASSVNLRYHIRPQNGAVVFDVPVP